MQKNNNNNNNNKHKLNFQSLMLKETYSYQFSSTSTAVAQPIKQGVFWQQHTNERKLYNFSNLKVISMLRYKKTHAKLIGCSNDLKL